MSRLARFLGALDEYSSRPCIDDGNHSYRYAELLEEIRRWQSSFDELNVRPGTVVGVSADYSLAAVAALLALFAKHVIAALIPRGGDVRRYLADAHVSAFLEVDEDGSYRWCSVSKPPSHPLLDSLRRAGEGGVVVFTSGSTGCPKAALQSVERFLYKFRRPGRCLRTLAFMRFDHIAGLDTLFYTLASGGTVIFTRRRDPGAILELIESCKVEVLPTSPSFLRMLCKSRNDREYDLSSLKVVTYGAEAMDSSTLGRVNSLFPAAQISQKYGTTETGSPRSVSRSNESLWLKMSKEDVETKVVDGVLWIRWEGTILGYLNAPSPVDEQGWYCTGDLVDVDGDWIRFRGRTTDIINVGGEKVSPIEVEQSILELDFVRDAVVSAQAHSLVGQIVTARVLLTASAPEPKQAVKLIRRHCRERLASYKVPVSVEIASDSFSNDRQKVQRRPATS